MYSLRFTIILAIILFVPFMLRYKFGNRFEPFPAVLLPSGAGKTLVNVNEIRSVATELLVQEEDGSWVPVNKLQLLYPIPPNNHVFILQREFGLNKNMASENRFFFRLLTKLHILKNRILSKHEKEEVEQWLKERLKAQGFTRYDIKIVHKEIFNSIQTHEILYENILNEKILYLD